MADASSNQAIKYSSNQTIKQSNNEAMKKIIFSSITVLLLTMVTSCDTKSCKCYVYDGNNTPQRVIEYVDESSPCSSLDYNRNTRYRTCLEYNEPDIDPTQIGQEYKK